jgi:dienelactone hydrolase
MATRVRRRASACAWIAALTALAACDITPRADSTQVPDAGSAKRSRHTIAGSKENDASVALVGFASADAGSRTPVVRRGDAAVTMLSRDGGPADSAAVRDDAKAAGDPHCTTTGCLRIARVIGDYSRESLLPYLDAGVQIDNGYTVIVIEYMTRDRPSLATVTIPFPRAVPDGGYHIVANAHGTVGLDDPCQLADTTYGTGLAGLFGARGAIGVAPDYPGLGTPGILPYLVSDIEGAAVLDALRATRALAQSLGIALSGRYAAVGLSEGGHAVLAAAALHRSYAPELDIRAFGASGPASVYFEQWQRGIASDGDHIPYYAMLFYAWGSHYGYTGPSFWTTSLRDQIDHIMDSDCSFDFGGTRTTYQSALGTAADQIFEPKFLAAYRAGAFPQTASVFTDAFGRNRIVPYTQTAPLAIWQGDADTTVFEQDTSQLVAALRKGGVTLDYNVVPGAEHTTTAFGFVAQHQAATDQSIAWVFGQLDASANDP